jgi:hypothetical protein
VPLSQVFQVRQSSPEQTPPRRTTPPRTTAPETVRTAPETTRTGRPASPQGPPPWALTPPRAGADAAPTKTSGADGGVPKQLQTLAEKKTQGGSGLAGGRSGAGRRFKASFRRSDM